MRLTYVPSVVVTIEERGVSALGVLVACGDDVRSTSAVSALLGERGAEHLLQL